MTLVSETNSDAIFGFPINRVDWREAEHILEARLCQHGARMYKPDVIR
jgi:hypothetical protein